jgi:hypothetical protein
VKRLYSLAPLAALAGVEVQQLASKLRLSGSDWQRYRDDGVSEKVADRLARKLGFAAYNVWPEMIDHAIEDASLRCAHCDGLFIPTNRRQRFCSVRCQQGAWRRNRYRTDPKFREQAIATSRAYYAEAGEYARARQRRYYREHREAELARQAAYRERLKETG